MAGLTGLAFATPGRAFAGRVTGVLLFRYSGSAVKFIPGIHQGTEPVGAFTDPCGSLGKDGSPIE